VPAADPTADRPRLYVTLLSHLDTQWRWTVRDTIARFLPATVRENEAALARHPGLVLSFEGAFRYQLLAEYHPDLLATVRRLVGEGRWFPAGAALESFDANLPAPESIVRQILYGVRWFERELGLAGRDLFLPDCFGFPASLPTLAAHCGIAGFSTQKLSRGELMRSAFGIPFAVGVWTGTDGSELVSALDPGEYSGRVGGDLSRDAVWQARFAALGGAARPLRLLFYVGRGDKGGAVPEASLANLELSTNGAGPIEVRSAPSAALFTDLTAEERARLPRYQGELLLRLHATGCYTAQAAMKRWNRANQRLAFAAEAAATVAAWLGARPYPRAALELAWTRFLAHQMHDDLTGTSIPAAYRISWNDEAIAANRFATVLADAAGAVAAALDTRAEGAPIVVFHPGQRAREAVVEVARDAGDRAEPVAFGAEGALPTQAGFDADGRPVTLFAAPLPALGFEAFDLRARERDAALPAAGGELEISERELANRRYRARFDDAGRLASLFDRRLVRFEAERSRCQRSGASCSAPRSSSSCSPTGRRSTPRGRSTGATSRGRRASGCARWRRCESSSAGRCARRSRSAAAPRGRPSASSGGCTAAPPATRSKWFSTSTGGPPARCSSTPSRSPLPIPSRPTTSVSARSSGRSPASASTKARRRAGSISPTRSWDSG
jgi:alpha-mannosidase